MRPVGRNGRRRVIGPVRDRAVTKKAKGKGDGGGGRGGVRDGPDGDGGGPDSERETEESAIRPRLVGGGVESECVGIEGETEGLSEGTGGGHVLSVARSKSRVIVGK